MGHAHRIQSFAWFRLCRDDYEHKSLHADDQLHKRHTSTTKKTDTCTIMYRRTDSNSRFGRHYHPIWRKKRQLHQRHTFSRNMWRHRFRLHTRQRHHRLTSENRRNKWLLISVRAQRTNSQLNELFGVTLTTNMWRSNLQSFTKLFRRLHNSRNWNTSIFDA